MLGSTGLGGLVQAGQRRCDAGMRSQKPSWCSRSLGAWCSGKGWLGRDRPRSRMARTPGAMLLRPERAAAALSWAVVGQMPWPCRCVGGVGVGAAVPELLLRCAVLRAAVLGFPGDALGDLWVSSKVFCFMILDE